MDELKITNSFYVPEQTENLGMPKQVNSNADYKINKRSKLLIELSDSIRLLENYINNADTKVYNPSSSVEYDAEDLVKIYLPKGRI